MTPEEEIRDLKARVHELERAVCAMSIAFGSHDGMTPPKSLLDALKSNESIRPIVAQDDNGYMEMTFVKPNEERP